MEQSDKLDLEIDKIDKNIDFIFYIYKRKFILFILKIIYLC